MIGLLVACAGTAPGGGDAEDTAVAAPSVWTREDDAGAADHDAAVVEEGFATGFQALQSLNASMVLNGYGDALSRGTAECPGLYASVGVTMGWSNACTTPDGWTYDGRGQAAWMPDAEVDGTRYAPYGEFINTSNITSPDGASLVMDGRGTHLGWMDGDVARLSSTLLGTFAYDAAGGSGWMMPSWLDGGPSVDVAIALSEKGAARTGAVEGGLAYAAGFPEGIVGIRAEGLSVALDGGCTAEGALVLLGDAGQRYTLALPSGSDCAACGDVTRAGRTLGEVCLDFADLVGWDMRPW